MPPPFRFFRVHVAAINRPSPSFQRITFRDPELTDLVDAGADQRIKVVIPLPGTGIRTLPFGAADWYAQWAALPDRSRNPLRTYTIRASRASDGEIDVDFAIHGGDQQPGPATAWATAARVGDELAVLGPTARGAAERIGTAWRPLAPGRSVLLAGDETAAPAVTRILAELPRDATGHALIEVADPADRWPMAAPAGVEVSWLVRAGRPAGSLLTQAIRRAADAMTHHARVAPRDVDDLPDQEVFWDVPDADDPGSHRGPGPGSDSARVHQAPQVWLAGETGAIKHSRRQLLTEFGWPRRAAAFMGYWRRGQPGS